MVGLFDSGSGGLNTVRYVKELHPEADLVYLIDRKRAPYGIKNERELVEIASENIKVLSDMGASRVLIACCTASTVYEMLPRWEQSVAVPIINEVAKHAKNATRVRRIGVIATSHTVASHAFARAMEGCEVSETALGELVNMIDSGLSDATVDADSEERVRRMILPALEGMPDTLVLGCTHFPALKRTIARITRPYGVRQIVDSAYIGAELIAAESRKLKG